MLGRDSLRSVDLSTVPTPELPVKLSVVVPCCDEADGLAELNRRLSEVCRAVVGDSYEIVLVNDGSVDETWSMMLRLTEVESHVIAVDRRSFCRK